MKIYKDEKNIKSSAYDFIYSLNFLPTLNVSVFKFRNIKPSSACMNC